MSRFVYRGSVPEYVVNNPVTRFRQGIPTWVPLPLRDALPYADFEPYDADKHQRRDKILIDVTRSPEIMFGLAPFLQRVVWKFPTCDITICGDTRYADVVRPYAKIVDSYKQVETQQYYRHWKLTGGANDSHLNLVQLAHHPWWQMALQYLNIYDEDDLRPPVLGCPIVNHPICVVKLGTSGADTWAGMGDYLESRLRDAGYEVNVIDTFDEAKAVEQYNTILNSSYVIFCGYSPLIYAAGWGGVPSFCMIPSGGTKSRIVEGQFSRRARWDYTFIGAKHPADGVGELVWDRISGLIGVVDGSDNAEVDPGAREDDSLVHPGGSSDNGDGPEPGRGPSFWDRVLGSGKPGNEDD